MVVHPDSPPATTVLGSHHISPTLSCGGIGCVTMVIVVRAHLLDQFVVNTIEGDIDAYDLEGL